MQLDLVAVLREPCLPWGIEPVAWPIVEDQEHLSPLMLRDEQLQELVEGVAVEHVGELVGELRLLLDGEGAKDVGSLPFAEGVDSGLNAFSRPRLVQRAVEPEAGFVLEDYDSVSGSGFFLISGRRSSTQVAWASASARASLLRGRWTEKPSWLRSRGM